MDRRQLLAVLSTLTGGAMFGGPVACGDADPPQPGDGDSPTAYRFHIVTEGSGVALFADDGSRRLEGSSGETIPHLRGEPIYSDAGKVYFIAVDADDVAALECVKVDFEGSTPSFSSPERVVAIGDTLDGDTVEAIGTMDLSPGGVLAVALKLRHKSDSGEGRYQAVYLDRGDGLQRLFGPTFRTSDGHRLRGVLGHFATAEDHLILSARYEHAQPKGYLKAAVGLFRVPFDQPEEATVLVGRGHMPDGLSTPIREFGLVHTDGTHWVAEAYVTINPRQVDGEEERHTVILMGDDSDDEPTVVAATHSSLPGEGSEAVVVDAATTPRLYDGSLHMLQHHEQRQRLHQDGEVKHQSSTRSPTGRDVAALSPPVGSADGEAFFTQAALNEYEQDGTTYRNATVRELVRSSAAGLQVLLQSGDTLGTDDRPIWDISLGAWTRQADRAGRLVFRVLLATDEVDPENPPFPSVIVLGIPV